jgi:vacuolar-type H+-ATPase subunit F/Vma7
MKSLDIAALGDEELISALRLAGVNRYHMIEGNNDVREDARKALADLLAEPDVGIIIILEDYAEYVEDLVTQVRRKKATTPVIVEVPSKFGTKHPDVKVHYRALIRESIGFEVEV